jgi:hypothetical protein
MYEDKVAKKQKARQSLQEAANRGQA